MKRPYGDSNLQRMSNPLNNRSIVIKEPDVLVTLIDTVSISLAYVGRAACNSSQGSPVWQIREIKTVGTITSVKWADADGKFDNIWSDRATLTYQ